MSGYLVNWAIDSEKTTPKAAAAEALETQRDPMSAATVFEVRNNVTGKIWKIDVKNVLINTIFSDKSFIYSKHHFMLE